MAIHFAAPSYCIREKREMCLINKICDLTDDKHFVVVNAYLIKGIRNIDSYISAMYECACLWL